MSGMNVNGNKKTAAAAKAQKPKQAKKVVKKKQLSIAEALHKFADNNSAAVGKTGFTNLIKKINKDTVISVIQNYDNLYNNDKIKNSTFKDAESIVETILDETGSKESAIREALVGEGKVRGIFTLLLDKAKDAGVGSDAIAKYKADFIKELNKELKGSRYTRSSAKMDEIIQVVIQAIDNQKILTPTEKKVAVAAVNTKQIDTINIIVNRYNKALKDFNAQMKRDGWAGDVADGLSRIWGSNNTATKVRKDLKIAKKQIDELKAARDKGKAAFEAKFKEIFGVPYNAQNIMAYEKQESTYKEAAIRYGIEEQFKSRCSLLLKGQPLKEETTSDMSGMVARRPSGTRVKATKEQVYKREFNNLAKAMGKDGTNTLNQLLEASNANTLEEKYQILQNIAKDIYTNLHKAAEKACGGRSLADVEKTYQNSYKAAFGLHNDILKRVTDYNISQEKGTGIVKGATVAAAAIATGILTGGTGAAAILTISGVAAGATAVTEISDRMTSGEAIDAAKKGGLKEYAKTVYNDVQWTDVAVQSLVSGAMAAVFAGQSIAVGKFATYTASKLGLSPVGSALMATGATTLSGIAFPIGTEYAFTGKITVEGVAFAVVLAVVAGTIQVVKISQMASAAKAAAQSEAEASIEFARKTLGIPDDVELTPEVVKQYRNAKAKALHSDRTVINGVSNDLEMALVNDAYKTLTDLLKSGTAGAAKTTTPNAQGSDEMGLVPADKALTVVSDAVAPKMPTVPTPKIVSGKNNGTPDAKIPTPAKSTQQTKPNSPNRSDNSWLPIPRKVINAIDNTKEYLKLVSKIPEGYKYRVKELKNNPNVVRFLNQYIENGGQPDTFFYKIELSDWLFSLGKENNEICNLLLSLQKANVSDKNLQYILRNIYNNRLAQNVNSSIVEKVNKFINTNVDESALLTYVESQIKYPSKNSTEFINYVAKFNLKDLQTMLSGDYLNNIKIYLKEMEIERKDINITDLKNLLLKYTDALGKVLQKCSNYSENNRFDFEYIVNIDKKMFQEIIKIMDSSPKKSTESISEYFTRICDIRSKRIEKTKQAFLKEQRETIEKGYSETDDYEPIVLSPGMQRCYENRGGDQYFVPHVAATSTPLGGDPRISGVFIEVSKEPELERYAFQKYPRYNSTEFLGSDGFYKYAPVYRLLSPKNRTIKDFSEEYFPNIGEEYSPRNYQCCAARFERCEGEPMLNPFKYPVVMEIHPKSETSKAFFVGGFGGEEMRYPADTKFIVINKYIDIYEDASRHARVPMAHIVLQEL